MENTARYPIIRGVFIILLALTLVGDVAFLLKMGGDILGVS